ncbi:MAG: hypothetical protein R3C26_01880 [Calditrichia bacterium]
MPEAGQVLPASIAVDFSGNGSEIRQSVTVTPPATSGEGWLAQPWKPAEIANRRTV